MMSPSNQVEQSVEDSSSSGGSFVHSMNLLSTAKGGTSGSSDSRDSSDASAQLTKRDETSEVSEESDHENTKETTPFEPVTLSGAMASPSEQLSQKTETFGKQDATVTQQHGFGGDFGTVEVKPSASFHDSCTSVEALAEIAVEAARVASTTESSPYLSSEAPNVTAHVEPPGNSAHPNAAAKASASSLRLSGGSSDQSVEHTVDSSVSGNSSRGGSASALHTGTANSFQAVGGEPKAPLGHIHVKGKQSPNSIPMYHPTPTAIASMAPMPIMSALGPTKTKPSSSLRRGKWTVEEEAYVARVIQDFNSGFLNAPAGTTLRSYLSEKLHCDPMRITKKFTGDACIGKRVFHPAVRCASNSAAIDKAQAELEALERRWRRRLEMQQRESAKKAAASAAAAVAAATGRSHSHLHRPPASVRSKAGIGNSHIHSGVPPHPGSQHVKQTAVARTATWLERANAILSTQNDGQPTLPQQRTVPSIVSSGPTQGSRVESLPPQEIENQMREVQRLIHEGPVIQQTTAGLPHILDQGHGSLPSSSAGQRKVTEDASLPSVFVSSTAEPVDKRARTASAAEGVDTSGAEDAEALVGFLNSVRASAEASGDRFSAP